MDVRASDMTSTQRAPADNFTGPVWFERLVEAPAPARVRAVCVHFEPGGRTAWHTHPLGQTLYVTSGVGLVQAWGEAARVIRPGDVVWIRPEEKHWHGARPDNAMTHIAIQEALNGSAGEWMEHVSEEQYADASRNT